MKITILVAAAIALGACAANSSNWAKPGTSAARTEQDIRECKYEAEKSTPRSGGDPIAAVLSDGMRTVELRDQCLTIRGYRRR